MKKSDSESFLKEQKHLCGAAIRSSIIVAYLGGVFVIGQAALLAHIINALVFEGEPFTSLYVPCAALIGVFLLRFALLSFSDCRLEKATASVCRALREKLYDKLQSRGSVFIVGQGSGALMNTLSDGIDTIGKYYRQYLPAKAMMMALPLTIWLFVLPMDWLSAVVMIVTAPLIPLFMILIGKGAESRNQKQWRELARMGNHFLDVIQGLTTLKVMGASKREEQAIANTSETYRRSTMEVLRIAFLSSVTLEFFSTVSIALIAVFIGFRLMWGQMDFYPGFFILLLAPEFYAPLRKMGTAYHARMEAIGAAEKMGEIMGEHPQESDTSTIPSKANSNKETGIRFEDVHCSYDGTRKALNGISFDLKPGSNTALVGPSGAGKSTILTLLLGFVSPNQGQVLVQGEPLDERNLEQWRAQLAWVPQDPTLFWGSVMDNIRLGNTQASDDDIIALCRKLKIHDFIMALPQGYQTMLGEKGYGLSGGQKRRLAIARALLRDKPVLLMDEPTASLDKETENILYTAMRELAKDKTVITIAHRIQTVKNADQILVLQDGKIIDRGSHDALKKRSKLYRDMSEQVLIDGMSTAQRSAA